MERPRRPFSRYRTRRERGAVLILTAIAMVAMMCFAGLAIDMGVVRAQRAQYQATADAAALYATFLIRQPGADVQSVAADVREFVSQNLDIAGGTSDAAWRNCTDSRRLATVSTRDASIRNDCISFLVNGSESQARVRLPLLQVRPVIGLGLAAMEVTAVAGAEGSGSGCDAFAVAGCTTTTTAAPTTAPTTTRAPSPTTTRAPSPTTTRAPSPTTTRRPSPTTTRAPSPTTTRAPSPTTTRAPSPTTTRAPSPTTTRPPVPTTLDIGF